MQPALRSYAAFMQAALPSSVPRSIGLHGKDLGVDPRNTIVMQAAYDRTLPALERIFLKKYDRKIRRE